ncbi:MAG: hypothetical protein O4861_05735 [Trichodesmium sp. St16_bin4-tuft]|nr:hypothetical protein [Trichodesmium sp. St5_bin8]MDE5091281.1 hypothetical protein [Trichodesmium sp. St18_bin3_1_1]MDE5097865.1 hypothetical protein [Trichodesmium sp. St16_bin4-tuft]MDE5104669.1 hypothetical protein [Trichodesmium sp. St19_bin2]
MSSTLIFLISAQAKRHGNYYRALADTWFDVSEAAATLGVVLG